MDRALPLFAIGLLFGGGIGFVLAAGAGVTLDGHDHSAPGAHAQAAPAPGGPHDHAAPRVVPAGADAPGVAVALTRDPVSGWNLRLTTTNFEFAPESAGGAHVPGKGHAHVHVDGEKIARLYGPWMHLATLPDGATVDVTLNSNDHRPLSVGSSPVVASVRAP